MIALGPVPVRGEDEVYPKGFVVSAEKCPNRRGVEAVIAHFTGGLMRFDEFLGELRNGEVDAAWVSGGYPTDWIDEADGAAVRTLGYARRARLVPVAAVGLGDLRTARRRVGRARRLVCQPAGPAANGRLGHPPAERRAERGQPALGPVGPRRDCSTPASVLGEVAREILYFSAAVDPVPEVGVDLKVNLLAGSSQ